ncbi:hypothetical protein SO802_029564 [Lithocarpus litseifolius]|uniref:AAA+ ATPase domain-containing protein n=1 Tax=Lithocarpus litseifolius TaxID=425828 RepID=A0AAW2BZ51_9ROSI
MYDVSSTYLRTKIVDSSKYLNVGKTVRQERPTFDIVPGAEVIDSFQGIKGLKWKLHVEKGFDGYECLRYFTLSFDKKLKEVVIESYLAEVISRSKAIQEAERVLKLYSRDFVCGTPGREWSSIILEHPTTFEKLAMDPMQKRMLKDDLHKFVNRKEWYKKVGKAWKRGYLLYGPPSTGKSSLIAAMANYLKFDVYDLDLSRIRSDSELRRIFLSSSNRSIRVIEDIDCAKLEDREIEERFSLVCYIIMARKMLIDGEVSQPNEEEAHYNFDLFVIGAESGGVRASRFSASYGAKVGICELPLHPISSEVIGGVGGSYWRSWWNESRNKIYSLMLFIPSAQKLPF